MLISQFSDLEQKIKSLYCPETSLILPYSNERDAKIDAVTKPSDLILEMDENGDQYIHLVLPADKISMLSGIHDQDSFFGFNNTFTNSDDQGVFDRVLVEIGCKVYEVNKVNYRATPSVSSRVHLEDFAM